MEYSVNLINLSPKSEIKTVGLEVKFDGIKFRFHKFDEYSLDGWNDLLEKIEGNFIGTDSCVIEESRDYRYWDIGCKDGKVSVELTFSMEDATFIDIKREYEYSQMLPIVKDVTKQLKFLTSFSK